MVNGELIALVTFQTNNKTIYNHNLGISGLVTSGICHLFEGTKVRISGIRQDLILIP
jgi:hypothetical protein